MLAKKGNRERFAYYIDIVTEWCLTGMIGIDNPTSTCFWLHMSHILGSAWWIWQDFVGDQSPIDLYAQR